MSTRTVVAVSSVSKAQLKDDILELALANGFTEQEVVRYERVIEYRRQYSSRPDVVEKRKQYARRRYLKMKALTHLLKQATV